MGEDPGDLSYFGSKDPGTVLNGCLGKFYFIEKKQELLNGFCFFLFYILGGNVRASCLFSSGNPMKISRIGTMEI